MRCNSLTRCLDGADEERAIEGVERDGTTALVRVTAVHEQKTLEKSKASGREIGGTRGLYRTNLLEWSGGATQWAS